MGSTHRPVYRLTAVDGRKKRDGRVIEELGQYNPREADPAKQANLKLERCAYWLSVGAQPSETVAGLLHKAGLSPKPGTKAEAQNTTPASA
jgi:small subunit ribosomal protein S16